MSETLVLESEVQPVSRDKRGHLWKKGELVPGAKPWGKGISGNPGGAGDAYHRAVSSARGYSPAMVDRMVELAELDNVDETGRIAPLSRHADRNVAFKATDWLWQCAWGKGRPVGSDADKPGVTIEQRRDEAMAILQAAFERVIVASKAQEEQAQVVEQDASDKAAT